MLGFIKRLSLVLACLVIMFYLCAWILSANGFEENYQPREDEKPVKAVTVQDVLDANIPMPTLRHVSLPQFPFKPLHAFPDAEQDELVVIKEFHEPPMLANMDLMDEMVGRKIRHHYPETLPPVEERLPLKPAVVRGPDGIGTYGGTWHHTSAGNYRWESRFTYESLVRFDPSGNLQPGYAYDWKVEDENKVFTFYLRPGHKFSDGRPFTSHDITYVVNTVIGSKRWLNPPDWMQATDGSSVIYDEDVLDWVGLAKAILGELEVEGGTVGKQLFSEPVKYADIIDEKLEEIKVAQEQLKQALKEISQMSAGSVPDEKKRVLVVGKINRVLKNRGFYDAAVWKDFDWDSEIAELKKIGWSNLDKKQTERLLLLLERNDSAARMERFLELVRTDGDSRGVLSRLNVLFFRMAYSDYVTKAVKTQAKVEAVPDENGNDNHIVRYTFRKPASFFLEKIATFMFYRCMGGSSEFDRERHPDGYDKLFPLDVLNWQGFGEALLEQVGRDTVTPGGQLWKLLDDEVKRLIQANVKSEQWSDADQETIITGINQALESRDYYDAAGWSGIDWELEKELIFTNNQTDHPDEGKRAGYEHITTRREKIRRIKQIYVAEEFRSEIERDGDAGLTDDEIFVFNVEMFRRGFTDPAGTLESDLSLVAPCREIALNYAAQNAPKPYESWVQWAWKGRENYHPVLNPHAPSLRAWRKVSEKIDKNQYLIRNPYYYRVDEAGNQLPYINILTNSLEPDREARIMKIKSGAIDCMSRGIRFQDYTTLKQSEKVGYEVRLWSRDRTGLIALLQHQLHGEEAYRILSEEPRVRHALSLAIDRQEIIDVVYGGVGEPAQYGIPKGSPFYSEKLANAFVEYDPERANRILDELGLDQRSADGTRLIPVPGKDGQPDQLVPWIYMVQTKEAAIPIQAIQMVCNYWQKIGINAQMKIANANFDRYAAAGKLDVGATEGGGSYFGPLLAGAFAPTHPAESLQWSDWVDYLRNNGKAGKEPPDRMIEIEQMWGKVRNARNKQEQLEAWQVLMDHAAYRLPVIGILEPPGMIMLVKNNFKNVPELAMGGWMPHHPGNACAEAFYFDDVDDSQFSKDSEDSE